MLKVAPTVDFSIFTASTTVDTTTKALVTSFALSTYGKSFILSQTRYRPVRIYQNGTYQQGYYNTTLNFEYGLTATEAYRVFEQDVADAAIFVKNFYPDTTKCTQNQFDTLVSLYFFEKNLQTLLGNSGTYDIQTAFLSGTAENFANILMDTSTNRQRHFKEAKIYALGEYGDALSTAWLRNEGIQYIRANYPDNFPSVASSPTTEQKRQARLSYYREVQLWLSGMTELEKQDTTNLYDQVVAGTIDPLKALKSGTSNTSSRTTSITGATTSTSSTSSSSSSSTSSSSSSSSSY